jgi:uncharacterized protein (TIGR02284 family)
MQDYTALKDVIGICRSTEQGFRGAANAVKTPALRQLFEEFSEQRGRFASELLQAGRKLGLYLDDPAGVGGVLHSVWMEMKAALSDHSEHQILDDISRTEENTLKTYRQALQMSLNEEVRTVLERQAGEIEATDTRIRALCEATAAESGEERTRRAY